MLGDRITESMANMMLRQMGAVQIKNMQARVNKVKFKLEEHLNVTYIYEVKKNDVIYLNRVRPYAMFLGSAADERELVEAIRKDLRIFRHAHDNPNFHKYIEVTLKMQDLVRKLESAFLDKDVSLEKLEEIGLSADDLRRQIDGDN
jgi:hypothetical protein